MSIISDKMTKLEAGLASKFLGTGEKGFKYDKNNPFEAMASGKFDYEFMENENGRFLNIFNANNNQQISVNHLLCDYDFDGLFDSYQYSESDRDGNRLILNDREFDGIFDQVINEFTNGVSAVDSDADGEIDLYEYPIRF